MEAITIRILIVPVQPHRHPRLTYDLRYNHITNMELITRVATFPFEAPTMTVEMGIRTSIYVMVFIPQRQQRLKIVILSCKQGPNPFGGQKIN